MSNPNQNSDTIESLRAQILALQLCNHSMNNNFNIINSLLENKTRDLKLAENKISELEKEIDTLEKQIDFLKWDQ